MHLSRILDQIKRHPSPTEALTKLGKAMVTDMVTDMVTVIAVALNKKGGYYVSFHV